MRLNLNCLGGLLETVPTASHSTVTAMGGELCLHAKKIAHAVHILENTLTSHILLNYRPQTTALLASDCLEASQEARPARIAAGPPHFALAHHLDIICYHLDKSLKFFKFFGHFI